MNQSDIFILVDFKGFDKKIARALLKPLGRFIDRLSKTATTTMRDKFTSRMLGHTVVQNVLHGMLRGELGVVNASEKIDTILRAWIDGFRIEKKEPKLFGDRIACGLSVQMVRSDWSEVKNLSASIQISNTRQPDGSFKRRELHWLEWLLEYGSSIIVRDYDFTAKITRGSRTGLGIMIKGTGWSVPEPFTGTNKNNFVIDVLNDVSQDIIKVLQSEANKGF